MLEADRSKRLAPVSVARACTSILLPVPRGPASMTERMRGLASCTAGEPRGGQGGGGGLEITNIEYGLKERALWTFEVGANH